MLSRTGWDVTNCAALPATRAHYKVGQLSAPRPTAMAATTATYKPCVRATSPWHAWVADSHCHVRPLRALAMWERGGPAGRGGGGRAAGASRLRVLRERERREGCECGECVNVGNPDPARGAWCCGVPNLIRGIQHACRVPGEREPNRYKRVFDVLACFGLKGVFLGAHTIWKTKVKSRKSARPG